MLNVFRTIGHAGRKYAKYTALILAVFLLFSAEISQAQSGRGWGKRFQNVFYTIDSTCFYITVTRDTICFPNTSTIFSGTCTNTIRFDTLTAYNATDTLITFDGMGDTDRIYFLYDFPHVDGMTQYATYDDNESSPTYGTYAYWNYGVSVISATLDRIGIYRANGSIHPTDTTDTYIAQRLFTCTDSVYQLTGPTGPTGPAGSGGIYRLQVSGDTLFLTEDGNPVDTVIFSPAPVDSLVQDSCNIYWFRDGVVIDTIRLDLCAGATGATGATGAAYRSIVMDGVNETVRLDSTWSNNVDLTASWTLNFWAKTGDTGALYVFGERNGSARFYCLKTALGRYQFAALNISGVTGVDISTDDTWEDNAWHMVTIRNPASGQAEIFVDGDTTTTQVVTTAGTSNYNGSERPYIGAAGNGAAEWLGSISHVSLFKQWLDGDEIVELYNTGSLLDLSTYSQAADLTFWMRVDENSDLTTSGGIVDGAGNNNATGNNLEAGDLSSDIP